jgi:hypothetical protein
MEEQRCFVTTRYTTQSLNRLNPTRHGIQIRMVGIHSTMNALINKEKGNNDPTKNKNWAVYCKRSSAVPNVTNTRSIHE